MQASASLAGFPKLIYKHILYNPNKSEACSTIFGIAVAAVAPYECCSCHHHATYGVRGSIIVLHRCCSGHCCTT